MKLNGVQNNIVVTFSYIVTKSYIETKVTLKVVLDPIDFHCKNKNSSTLK